MHFARGAQGVEKIPNSSFWISVPGLVKVSERERSVYQHQHQKTFMEMPSSGNLAPSLGGRKIFSPTKMKFCQKKFPF